MRFAVTREGKLLVAIPTLRVACVARLSPEFVYSDTSPWLSTLSLNNSQPSNDGERLEAFRTFAGDGRSPV